MKVKVLKWSGVRAIQKSTGRSACLEPKVGGRESDMRRLGKELTVDKFVRIHTQKFILFQQ